MSSNPRGAPPHYAMASDIRPANEGLLSVPAAVDSAPTTAKVGMPSPVALGLLLHSRSNFMTLPSQEAHLPGDQ